MFIPESQRLLSVVMSRYIELSIIFIYHENLNLRQYFLFRFSNQFNWIIYINSERNYEWTTSQFSLRPLVVVPLPTVRFRRPNYRHYRQRQVTVSTRESKWKRDVKSVLPDWNIWNCVYFNWSYLWLIEFEMSASDSTAIQRPPSSCARDYSLDVGSKTEMKCGTCSKLVKA